VRDVSAQTSDRSGCHEGQEAPVMARKKRAAPYPEWPDIPDELWLPFVISLTGNQRRDASAIVSLAYIFNIDPDQIRFRLEQELAEEEERIVLQHPAHPVLQ
jgi:hypothetical protein